MNDALRIPEPTPTTFQQVAEFHRAFGAPIASIPTLDIGSRLLLRLDLLVEEVIETIEVAAGPVAALHMREAWDIARREAVSPGDDNYAQIAAFAKELADVEVVTQGFALETGIPLPAVTAEVMRSNMSKLGRDGKPVLREDGKVLKGPDYREADVADVIYPF